MSKRIITCLLTILLLLISVFSLFGCDGCKNKENDPIYLVKDGICDYKVISPEDPEYGEDTATTEFNAYFMVATGISLENVVDSQVAEIAEEDKYIIIGNTTFARANEITPSIEEVGRSGYVIKMVGNSIYVVGGSGVGTQFAVYEFLNAILNFDYFYEGIYYIDKAVKEIKIDEYDIKIIPDIEFNDVQFVPLNTNSAFHKMSMYNSPVTPIGGLTGHASLAYIPKDKYLNENDQENYHPKWYMSSKNNTACTQVCYTAHGDGQEYNLLVETVAGVIKDVMRNNKFSFLFDFSMTDDENWCDCDACMAVINKHYGANIAVVIPFLNDVAENVSAWFETDDGKAFKREFYIKAYAYWTTLDAPVSYNSETKEYSTIDDSVMCNKNVVIQLADLQSDYTQSMFSSTNEDMYELYEKWSYLCPHMAAYIYSTRFSDHLMPYDTFNDMQEYYQYFKSKGIRFLHNSGHSSLGFATGWNALKMYVGGKLGIDVDIDFEATIDKFFDNVYLSASEPMRQLFNEWRYIDEYNTVTYPTYAGKSSCYKVIGKAEYFGQGLLERWNGLIDESLERIEYLKTTDIALYNQTYKMIVGERVWINYLYYQIYGITYSNTPTVNKFNAQLVEDLQLLGIRYIKAGLTVDNIIKDIKGGK